MSSSRSLQLDLQPITGSDIENFPDSGLAFELEIKDFYNSLVVQGIVTNDDGQSDIQHFFWGQERDTDLWVPLVRLSPIETFVEPGGTVPGYTVILPKSGNFGAVYKNIAVKQSPATPTVGVSVRVTNQKIPATNVAFQFTDLTNITSDNGPGAISAGVTVYDGVDRAAGIFKVTGATVNMTLELWGMVEGLSEWILEGTVNVALAGNYLIVADPERLLHYSRLVTAVSGHVNGTLETSFISQGYASVV